MTKGRFITEQIIGVLKQHAAGRKVSDLAPEIGVSDKLRTLVNSPQASGRSDRPPVSRPLPVSSPT